MTIELALSTRNHHVLFSHRQISGVLTIAADTAALLPDSSTEDLDGLATVTGFVGTLDLATGGLSLEAGTAEVTVELQPRQIAIVEWVF